MPANLVTNTLFTGFVPLHRVRQHSINALQVTYLAGAFCHSQPGISTPKAAEALPSQYLEHSVICAIGKLLQELMGGAV